MTETHQWGHAIEDGLTSAIKKLRTGHWRAGTQLAALSLGRAVGVSTSTARLVLTILERDGFFIRQPQGSPRVRKLTKSDIAVLRGLLRGDLATAHEIGLITDPEETPSLPTAEFCARIREIADAAGDFPDLRHALNLHADLLQMAHSQLTTL